MEISNLNRLNIENISGDELFIVSKMIQEEVYRNYAIKLEDISSSDIKTFTISELRDYENSPKKIVFIKDDYKYGLFFYDENGTEADDGIFVIRDSNNKVYKRVDNRITPRIFGAVGDGITDDSAALNLMFNYTTRGEIEFENKTYLIKSPIIIINKNGNSGNVAGWLDNASNFKINGNGAVINSQNPSNPNLPLTYCLSIERCKRITVEGLRVNGTVYLNGVWESSFKNVMFHDVYIGNYAYSVFGEFYWNSFDTCIIKSLHIYTGTLYKTECNQNIFTNCKIWSDVAECLNIYGSKDAQALVFNNCDLFSKFDYSSFQSTHYILKIEQEVNDVSIFFEGSTYNDGTLFLPDDLKNVKVYVNGNIVGPNGGGLKACKIDTASISRASELSSFRGGMRSINSPINFIVNGDLGADTNGLVVIGYQSTVQSGNHGLKNKKIKFNGSAQFDSVQFYTNPLPFDGFYSLHVIGKIIDGQLLTYSEIHGYPENHPLFGTVYGPIKLKTVTSSDTYTRYVKKGDIFKITFINPVNGYSEFEIEYVGLTFGAETQLLSIIPDPLLPPKSLVGNTQNEYSKQKAVEFGNSFSIINNKLESTPKELYNNGYLVASFNEALKNGKFTMHDGCWLSPSMQQKPINTDEGYGLLLNGSIEENGAKIQIWARNVANSEIYVRTGWGTNWNNWVKLSNTEIMKEVNNEVSPINPNGNLKTSSALLIKDQESIGAWRIIESDGYLYIQKREETGWVTKQQYV